jgi:hypothetical protein
MNKICPFCKNKLSSSNLSILYCKYNPCNNSFCLRLENQQITFLFIRFNNDKSVIELEENKSKFLLTHNNSKITLPIDLISLPITIKSLNNLLLKINQLSIFQ